MLGYVIESYIHRNRKKIVHGLVSYISIWDVYFLDIVKFSDILYVYRM